MFTLGLSLINAAPAVNNSTTGFPVPPWVLAIIVPLMIVGVIVSMRRKRR